MRGVNERAAHALGETDVAQLRYSLITRNANAIPGYWKRCMPPSITRPAMEWVDARLGESLARLTDCAPALAAKLRREAALGTATTRIAELAA